MALSDVFGPFSNLPTALGGESRRTECYSFSNQLEGIPQEKSQFEFMRVDHNLCCDSSLKGLIRISLQILKRTSIKLNASNIL